MSVKFLIDRDLSQPPPASPHRSPPLPPIRRATSQTPLPEESPVKKPPKWSQEEDNLIIELRGTDMKWEDIAKHFPGRSAIACRLRYQNYLEKCVVWDEEKKNKLARLYAQFKDEMWQKVASEMQIPRRSAESTHWHLGEQEMSARANAPVFLLHPSPPTGHPATPYFTPTKIPQTPTPGPGQHHHPHPSHPQSHPQPPHLQHQRSDSCPAPRSRRNSSLSRRSSDGSRSGSSLPPQSSPQLPALQPVSESDQAKSMEFVESYLRKRRRIEIIVGRGCHERGGGGREEGVM
ncbi:uncharacterized protein BDZ99DRAFT_447905 [Mytilinidion resinicola]|uniref:Myb-like domain-containing protein n=1 Tax=Mytilinidion resinicola TaxID=574789 RepID=A0A6A6YFD1_9PEZI|nr:uncharacterized protein BDZ99DRAFT_447905 [Mytilinidion resinicola]KAF2807501.1 hypothetical protein BDZ99DRAFT_447905 [Mytilinidion resinicola]